MTLFYWICSTKQISNTTGKASSSMSHLPQRMQCPYSDQKMLWTIQGLKILEKLPRVLALKTEKRLRNFMFKKNDYHFSKYHLDRKAIKTFCRVQWDGSVSKGACCQGWQLEFHIQDPYGRTRKLIPAAVLWAQVHCGAQAYLTPILPTSIN